MSYKIGIDARRLDEAGIGDYCRHLVHALAQLETDHEYFLFVGANYSGQFDDLPENFSCVIERSPSYSLRELFSLSWRLLRLRLDLYHATHYVLPVWVPCRAVTTVHDIVDLLFPNFLPNRAALQLAQALIRRTLTQSNRIITDSQNTKTDLMDQFGVRGRKIRRIYSGVGADFAPQDHLDDQSVRDRLELPERYVLFQGASQTHKNEERTLRAFAEAVGTDDDLHFVGVGACQLNEGRLEHLLSTLELEGRVKWLPEVSRHDMPAALRGATAFLFPTLYEGGARPVVQALGIGIPVLTSNNATMNELVEGAAQFVRPTEIDNLRAGISRVLKDEDRRHQLAQAGVARATELTWVRTAQETLEVYEDALKARDRHRFLGRRGHSNA